MQLELDNIQESILPYGSLYAGKKIKDIPVIYLQDIKDKAPNKRSLTEKFILDFIDNENIKLKNNNNIFIIIDEPKRKTFNDSLNHVEFPNNISSFLLSTINRRTRICIDSDKKLNQLLSTHKA